MEPIALPKGIRGVRALPRQREALYNLIPTPAAILSRPGFATFGSGAGVCRGSFIFQDTLYQISGFSLIRVNRDKTTEVVGSIPGLGRVSVAVDHAKVALVCGEGYVFDGLTLSVNSSPNYVPSIDVVQVDGVFVYIPDDGSPAFYGLGDPEDILPEYFFDAESVPDRNTGAMVLSGDVYIGGTDSIELFRHTGPDTSPLRRVLNGAIPVGYIAGKVEYQGQLAFLGRDSGPKFYQLAGGQLTRISSDTVEDELLGFTEDELSECVGMRFNWRGQDVLVFRVGNTSYGYNGEWFYLTSDHDHRPFRGSTIDDIYGMQIVGDYWSPQIGYLSDVKGEFGDVFQREFFTFFRTPRDTNFNVNAVEIDAVSRDQGGSIGLRLSSDGEIFGQEARRDLPAAGNYKRRVMFNYPGGLGSYESYMGIRMRTSENVDFNVDALWVDHG